jgi:tRNA-binding EMAP/Myf-like protein
MRVPVSWLREYVPLEMPLDELATRMAVSSAEVEDIERRGVPDQDGNLGRFRVGRVIEAAKHPNADRLQLCRVDVGEGEPLQIVCGAWNFGPGATVAVALPGAVLPGGIELERREVRGELSNGMILAEDEVDLGTDHTGIIVLDDGFEPGTPLADVLPIVDDVLVFEVTGNRPDLLSIYGLAREVAALYDLELARSPGRGPRWGTSLYRTALSGRTNPPFARLAEGTTACGRHATDLERRRRNELHDARARQPTPRVRLRHAARRSDRRAACEARREAPYARRDRARLDAGRSDDRRRRALGGSRRDHGRRGNGDRRLHDRRTARGGELRALHHLQDVRAAAPAD